MLPAGRAPNGYFTHSEDSAHRDQGRQRGHRVVRPDVHLQEGRRRHHAGAAPGDKVGVGGPAGSTTGYGYDSRNRLVTATEKTSTGAINASWAYAYDKNGNRTSNTAVIGGVSATTSQGYNAIDELTSLNGSTAGLSYDADGNQKTNPATARSGWLR